MNKRAIVIIALLVILLSGCVTLRMETRINRDGSGTKSFVLALSKEVMSMVESMAQESGASTEDIWSTARVGAESIEGAKVEEYSDEESEGIKVSVPFDNLQELEALSQSDAFEGTDTVQVSEQGDTKTLNATVSVGDLASGLDEASGGELEGFDLGEIDFEYTYSVQVEGEILAHTPTEIAQVEGSKVTWDLSRAQGESIELMVQWRPGGGPDLLSILLIAVVVGGVALVMVGIFLSVRGQRPAREV